MTEQTQTFDASRPSRHIKRYGREPIEVKYSTMVTWPMLRDSACVGFISYWVILGFAVVINAIIYDSVDMGIIQNDDGVNMMRLGGATVGAAITMFTRGEHYQLMFYKHTKPTPTSETVESISNPAAPEIVPTRTISGHRIEFEPKTLTYRDKKFVLNRWQVKWFVDQYNNHDRGIRKHPNTQWLGCQDIPDHPIRNGNYTLFIELCLKLKYVVKEANENKVTDLWVIEILELTPPTRSGDSE